MNRNLLTVLLALAVITSAFAARPAQAADTYAVDPVHSAIVFSISHAGVGVVFGRFNEFSGAVNIDMDDPSASTVEYAVSAASVDTAVEARDNHLRSADFFDVENFPQITFTSTQVEQLTENTFAVTGDLTLLGVTKRVTADVMFNGTTNDEKRGEVAGFTTTLKILRSDFGMDFGIGGIGDEVTLYITAEAIKPVI